MSKKLSLAVPKRKSIAEIVSAMDFLINIQRRFPLFPFYIRVSSSCS